MHYTQYLQGQGLQRLHMVPNTVLRPHRAALRPEVLHSQTKYSSKRVTFIFNQANFRRTFNKLSTTKSKC